MISSLKEFVTPYRSKKWGFTSEDAKSVPWTGELEEAVVRAISDLTPEPGDWERDLALMLSRGASYAGNLSIPSRRKIGDALWQRILHSDSRALSDLIQTLSFVAPFVVREHPQELLAFLRHKDSSVRLEVVYAIGRSGLKELYPELVPLRSDPYMNELNMGGAMGYAVRDAAFEVLSHHLNNKVMKRISMIDIQGVHASCWDWLPILDKLPKQPLLNRMFESIAGMFSERVRARR